MGNLNQNQLKQLMQSKSFKQKFEAMNAINLTCNNIKQVLSKSEKISMGDLAVSSRAIILRSTRGDYEQAFHLAAWAVTAKSDALEVIVDSFIKNKQSLFLVHQIARFKKTDARVLMKGYFRHGGRMKEIAEWLSAAGSILKTGSIPGETDGLWDWIKDTASDVKDAVVKAINTVADAVKAAGKNIANAISEVVNWTQNKINDFVEAIIEAGKSVSQILTEAIKKGTSALNKFIQAIIDAGKKGLEVLNWAVNEAVNVLQTALRKLEQLYGSFTSLLYEVVKMTTAQLSKIVEVLLEMGKSVKDFITRLERIAYTVAKKIVETIKKVGRSIEEILSALKNLSRYIVRIVFDALINLGNTIADLLKKVINWTAAQLSRLIGGLKDLGISLSKILDAIATFVGEHVIKLMKALHKIWKRVKTILVYIAQKTEHVIKTLLVALLGIGIHIKKVLLSILRKMRDAFRESLIRGLIQIGYSILTLMKEALKIGASAAAVLFAILMDIFGSHRSLTPEERAEAVKIFGSSIDLNMVRLTDASFAADFIMWINDNRAITTMYVINYKSGTNLSMDKLIHELTHVWQAVKSGGVYMLESLHSQFFGKGYNLTNNDVKNANGKLENLEREQQAVLVQDYWKAEFDNQEIMLSLDLIRPLAKQVYASSLRTKPINLLDLDINQWVFNHVSPINKD